MHAEGEDGRLVCKNESISVALVYVQVNDEYPADLLVMQQMGSSNGNIIQGAEALSPVRISMVGAAGQVHAYAGFKGSLCGFHGTGYTVAGSLDGSFIQGQANAPDHAGRQAECLDLLPIIRRMYP